MKLVATFTTCFSLLTICVGAPAFADDVVLKDGTVLSVTKLKATTEKVTFKLGGSGQSKRAEEVSRVYPSGDRNLDRAIKLMKKGAGLSKLKPILLKATGRGDPWAKACAHFFLGELNEKAGNTASAIKAYDAAAASDPKHFYAPVGLFQAAKLAGSGGVGRLDKLASGKFGSAWKDAGLYGKARLLLRKNPAKAKSSFSRLSGTSDDELRELAACGAAHCDVLAKKEKKALRTFRDLANRNKTGAGKGYAFAGLGDCLLATGKKSEAFLAYLRAVLLYPSGPERPAAAKAAAKLSDSLSLGGGQRLKGLAGSASYDDFAGKDVDAELMRRSLRFVSAGVVQEFAPQLEKKARDKDEQANLAFLGADAMKVVARASNDPDMLAEYETTLKRLQKKYPNHGRAALAGVDAFMAAKDRALALIAQAEEQTDAAKKNDLLKEGRALFATVLGPFKNSIEAMTKAVEALYEKGESRDLTEAEESEKQKQEFQRDLSEFLLAEAYASYAKTFPPTEDGRAENFKHALKLYEQYVDERGNFQKLLFYSYVGRGEMLMELKQYGDAIEQYGELVYVEPLYVPQDPDGKKAVLDMIKDVVIRAYYGWTRALLMDGKAAEAYKASQQIDDNPKAKGWKDHPMGTLLTFERSKALAGSGRGAKGAEELYKVIEKARQAPESEQIAALGMSRIGAGACRALSELSDLTGGEIYSPEIQYHVGIGYFLRQETELAIAGYKGVLTAAQTKADRLAWVPKAVKEIGNMLFQQERFLEAALAYQTVFTEFPNHEGADDAGRFAVAASKKAIEQFGEDATDSSATMVKFARSIEGSLGSSVGGDYKFKLILKNAKDLQLKHKWVAAAQEYRRIPKDYTNKEGKKIKLKYFANSIANAGYCYFQAYRKDKKNSQHLTQARKSLKSASDAARKASDPESQALACYYLGQLENAVKKPKDALAALKPFDSSLSGTAKYIVRARYQQAVAYFALAKAKQAEGCFKKVQDKTSDSAYGQFAYTMASKMRSMANKVFREDASRLDDTRLLRRKAAKFVKLWGKNSPLDTQREPVVFWAADTLFAGGDYSAALKAFTIATTRFKRPALKEKNGQDQNERFDLAELYMGYSMVMLGDAKKGLEQLKKVQNSAYVFTGRGDRRRAVMHGVMTKRALSKKSFVFKKAGRSFKQNVWFTTLEIAGKSTPFFDTKGARGDSLFTGVQGSDPAANYDPNTDVREIELTFKGHFMVVDGLARATWAIWKKTKDKNFLANEVAAASNMLVFMLRGMEGGYANMVSRNQLEPTDHALRLWDAQLQFLEIKIAREDYRGVASDLRLLKLRGALAKAPPAIRTKLEAMLALAEKKGGGK
jgi:tetratricopeptide (TPR) repeat protein